jgi:cholesterol transport system auxiliary component
LSRRRLALAAVAPLLAAGLCGCISVLPKSDPDQLYSFGHAVSAAAPEAAPAAPPAAPEVGVLLAAVNFPRAATGDQILTMTGPQSAYIAESRWVGPAAVLFREAVERRFEADSRNARLLRRGELGQARMVMRINVRDFEAVYANGPETIPTVVVSLTARLTRTDGTSLVERSFDVRRPAGDNRVSAIVEAFDAAVNQVLGELVTWTDQAAAALPPEAPVVQPAARRSTTTTSTTTTESALRPAPR